jgi:hypothetical protein
MDKPPNAPQPPENISPAETIVINLKDLRVGALKYYSVLAYPNRTEMAKRDSFFSALVARQLKEFTEIDPKLRKEIPGRFRSIKNEKIDGAMRRGFGRLLRRIRAGTAGWCLVFNGNPMLFDAPMPEGRVGFIFQGPNTVNEVMRVLVGDAPGDPKEAVANAAHRIWAESLPVLHLAMRNPVTIKIVEDNVNKEKNIVSSEINQQLLNSTYEAGWLAGTLTQAEKLRLALAGLLKTDPNDHLGRGFRVENAIRLVPLEGPSLSKSTR